MLSPKMLKIPNSHFWIESQLLMLSPKMLKSQIHIVAGGGVLAGQLLILSPKMLKSPKFTFSQVGEGGWRVGLKANF